jgi:butyrate kinase
MAPTDRPITLTFDLPVADLTELDLGAGGPGYILAVNPGSLSSKLGLGQSVDGRLRFHETELFHEDPKLTRRGRIRYRKELLLDFLSEHGAELGALKAICVRGGFLLPTDGGLIRLNELREDSWQPDRCLVRDVENAEMEHPCNYGVPIALSIIGEHGLQIPAFTLDPVTTDQMAPLAQYAGKKGFVRRSVFHALSVFATARLLAAHLGKEVAETNLVVCHLGGGISVVALRGGRAVDVNNALLGEPPFTPQRGIPQLGDAIDYAIHLWERGATRDRILFGEFTKNAGLRSYTGTADLRKIEARVREGDAEAAEAVQALAYQIAKAIGAMATAGGALPAGPLEAILFTGGGARCGLLLESIADQLGGPLAELPVYVYPGSLEQYAMVERTQRCLAGEIAATGYKPKPLIRTPRPVDRLGDLLDHAKRVIRQSPKTIALCVPNRESLEALRDARDEGVIKNALLVGERATIETEAQALELDLSEYGFMIVEPESGVRGHEHAPPARTAVRLVREGAADMLLKGLVHTGELFKAIVDKEDGLSRGGRLNMSCVTYLPRHDRLIVFSDPAINTETDNFDVMVEEARGAIRLARYLDIEPRVAFLSAIERTTPRIPSTLMAHELADYFTSEAERDETLADAVFQGPLSLDLALDPAVAAEKGASGPVAGEATILIFPDIESANIFYKFVTQTAPSRLLATAIPGTTAPCVICSRTDSEEVRMASLVLGAYLEQLYQRQLRTRALPGG